MQLSRKAIEEYKAIYKKRFGEDLSDEEASEQASNLLRFFQIISRPLPPDNRNTGGDRPCNDS